MADSPEIIVVMGSESDLPIAEAAVEVLEELEASFSVRVMSAHRRPEAVAELARGAEEAGVGVLIAIAGGAAHLAGVIAAHTTLPVIGVPVPTDRAGGFDS
ncbi:MAG: AIR carboxylase family protein, partial [Candidatus Brocadiia bacterium]